MKKVVLSLITVLYLLIWMPVSAEEEQVTVYMFSKDGCSACIAAQEYFDELESDYPDLFELKEIIVFDGDFEPVDNDRTNLLIEVYERFGEDSSKAATPTIVIGDYHTVGLPNDTDEVYDAIVDAKNNESEDEVMKIINKLELNLEELLIYESAIDDMPTVVEDETSGKYDAVIIIGIFVVLIGGFAGLVIAGKK